MNKVDRIKEKLADREWRIDNLYYIINKDGIKVKFIRNDSQKFLWNNMWYLNIILKDRQRGFSTLIAIFILDYLLFNSNTSAGIIDLTIDDAIKKLGKILFAYNCLPQWLKDEKRLTTTAKKELTWENGSTVSVGTSHRGGTLQILLISELGKIAAKFPERAREIRSGALNTLKAGNLAFIESTAEGQAGDFFDICQEARKIHDEKQKLTKLDFKFHFFAWWMGNENEMEPNDVWFTKEYDEYFEKLKKKIKADPYLSEFGKEFGFKLSPRKCAWYVKKAAQQKDDMKREYPGTPDEAFEAAVEGAYLGKLLEVLREKGKITVVPFDPSYPVNTGWDYGLSDTMTIWLHQRVGFEEHLIGYLQGVDDDVLYYWAKLNNSYQCVWGNHFLPHDFGHRRGGTANDASSPPKTLEDILNDAGMRDTFVVPRIENKTTAIAESRSWLPKAYFDKRECEPGLKCLQNYRREWDELNGCWKDRPRHDWASHGYDSFETLARGLNAYGAKGKIGEESVRRMRRLPPAPDWRLG